MRKRKFLKFKSLSNCDLFHINSKKDGKLFVPSQILYRKCEEGSYLIQGVNSREEKKERKNTKKKAFSQEEMENFNAD